MRLEIAERLKKLPPYLFVEIDRAKRKAKEKGRDLIDLGIGDPDQPTPKFIVDKLYQAAKDPANHRYALDTGMLILRQAISQWYKRRFRVSLDPDTEILPLIGSKEGIAHFPLTILNRGDYALVPDPCYPPYKGGTILAEGKPYLMPLLAKNNFLPDLRRLRHTILKKAKLIFVNYPNNPTAAVATDDFYRKLLQLARSNNLIICSDLAYSEITFDNYKPRSLLEFEGAKDCTIEFHSLSKTYNMTGWRIGWACGNSRIIFALAKVKTNIDSGIFQAIQIAAIEALESGENFPEKIRSIYRERRNLLVDGLNSLGWRLEKPKATFYIWAKLPKTYRSSIDFCQRLLEKASIVATPGVGFGKYGEGYVRFALTVSKERIQEAIERIRRTEW
jgi:LL-diaminopimelate aminotransferase